MTLHDYAAKHWLRLADLAREWDMSYQSMRQWAVGQGPNRNCDAAKCPSLAMRMKIEALSEGEIDAFDDWPLCVEYGKTACVNVTIDGTGDESKNASNDGPRRH